MKNSIKTLLDSVVMDNASSIKENGGILEQERIETMMEEWIVVSMNDTDEDSIRITKRENFTTTNMCDCYGNHGQKSDCYTAGCYSFENSESTCKNDCIEAMYKHFNVAFENDNLDDQHFDNAIEGENNLLEGIEIEEIKAFIANWKLQNEVHTEVTAWTYHDSHNFKTVVLRTDFGEPDCTELGEEETRAILAELPGFPHIEGTNTSIETENYRFSFDLWATNPWHCYVEKL